jgi:hypothetical protein
MKDDWPTLHATYLVAFLPEAVRDAALAAARRRMNAESRVIRFPVILVIDPPPFERRQ